MRQAQLIPENNITVPEKPILLTARKTSGWRDLSVGESNNYLQRATRVVYLGKCQQDKDMFCLYSAGYIMIFKGHLNSGKY